MIHYYTLHYIIYKVQYGNINVCKDTYLFTTLTTIFYGSLILIPQPVETTDKLILLYSFTQKFRRKKLMVLVVLDVTHGGISYLSKRETSGAVM